MTTTLYRIGAACAVSLGMGVAATDAEAGKLEDGYGDDPAAHDPTVPLDYPFEAIAGTPDHTRKVDMIAGVRLRAVSIPASVLDIWFFDDDSADWAYIEGRPRVSGTAMGLEFAVAGRTGSGLFYVEYIDAAVGEGYWDDVESPANHLDGEYLVPSAGLGLITFGANYAYEAQFFDRALTQGRFGLSFVGGGGVGLGVLAGRLDRWGPDNLGNPSYKRYLDGLPADSGKEVPRLFPMVDLNVGVRLLFGEIVSVRLEGGLHTLLYAGTSLGVVF